MKTAADGVESRSDAAQQLSASACVTPLFELDSDESDLCIGHAAPSEQQAMRASGVVIQPAHSATWLAEKAKLRSNADKRLPEVSTLPQGCWKEVKVSNDDSAARRARGRLEQVDISLTL